MDAQRQPEEGRPILFIRHGETDYNRRHVRCGGDVDIPLTEHGETQARRAAETLRAHAAPIDAIITSPLRRTRRTADLIRETLGHPCPLVLHDGLIERRLGAWNGLDIAATQSLLDAGAPPPGGETEDAFRARVRQALADILGRPHRLPLLVASKGVARVIGIIAGAAPTVPAGNAEVIPFDIPARALS